MIVDIAKMIDLYGKFYANPKLGDPKLQAEMVMTTIHHQLQKAREEEREKIYTLQAGCRERNLFSHRHGLCLCFKQDRYQEELDQDKALQDNK